MLALLNSDAGCPRNGVAPTQTTKPEWLTCDPLVAYTFVHKVGSGNYGTTYEVVKRSTGETFACKVLNKLQRHCKIKDIMKEVQILSALSSHPNVATLYEVWEHQNMVYLIMELCKGGELFDVIINRGHLSERDAAGVVRVILQVVQHCHSLGIMHRDLKPENFLLKVPLVGTDTPDAGRHIRAIDFGLSIFLEAGGTRREMAGSSYYMSPEVLKGHYGYPADIWSVGVIVYILLSGAPPFWGNTDGEIFDRIRRSDADLKGEPWPEISAEAKDFVVKLLDRDPARRPTAEQALKHAWLDQSTTQRRTAPLSRITFARLRRFTAQTRLRHMLMTVVAKHLSDEAIGNLGEMFAGMDPEGKGTVTYAQFEKALRQVGLEPDAQEVQALLRSLDVGESGHVDYTTFVAAAVDKKRVLTGRVLADIFAELDMDGDGYICIAELKVALEECGIQVTEDALHGMLVREGAADHNGLISPASFQNLMNAIIADDLVPAVLDRFMTGCRRFARAAHFRQLALHVMAVRLGEDDVGELHDLFDAMDVDGTGQVTFEQLRTALDEAGLKVAESELSVMFEALDVDKDGLLQYSDFLAAVLGQQQAALSEAQLKGAFEFFDADRDGRITLEEMRRALEDLMMEPGDAEALLAEADRNQDQAVDYEEFRQLLRLSGVSQAGSMARSSRLGSLLMTPSPMLASLPASMRAGFQQVAGGGLVAGGQQQQQQGPVVAALLASMSSFPGRGSPILPLPVARAGAGAAGGGPAAGGASAASSFAVAGGMRSATPSFTGRVGGSVLSSLAGREALSNALARRVTRLGSDARSPAPPSAPLQQQQQQLDKTPAARGAMGTAEEQQPSSSGRNVPSQLPSAGPPPAAAAAASSAAGPSPGLGPAIVKGVTLKSLFQQQQNAGAAAGATAAAQVQQQPAASASKAAAGRQQQRQQAGKRSTVGDATSLTSKSSGGSAPMDIPAADGARVKQRGGRAAAARAGAAAVANGKAAATVAQDGSQLVGSSPGGGQLVFEIDDRWRTGGCMREVS